MGKAQRLRAQRAANRESMSRRAPLVMLERAVVVIGDIFGTTPDCANAAAFLKLTADGLGYELKPRAVSLVVTDSSTDSMAFMGPKSNAFLAPKDAHKLEDMRPTAEDTGHMVLTSEDPLMVFDPNLAQLMRFNMYAEPLAFRVESTEPAEGEWVVSRGSLELRYLLDDNTALVPTYEGGLVDFAEKAAQLAVLLRRGHLPENLRLGPKS
jgi:hypothetical protein